MAELAIRLPVVIASPSDVFKERDVIERVITSMQKEAARHRLLLEPVRWERDLGPSLGRPQSLFNEEHLQRAELVVFLFWSSLGSASSSGGHESGTLEELRLARASVRSGSSDDVFVYFRRPTGSRAGEESVGAFREEVIHTKVARFIDYQDEVELAGVFEDHLRQWLNRWIGVPAICEDTMWKAAPRPPNLPLLGENALLPFLRAFELERDRDVASALGRSAVTAYQRHGLEHLGGPLDAAPADAAVLESWAVTKGTTRDDASHGNLGPALVRSRSGDWRFGHPAWFAFFCSVGLFGAILEDRYRAVEKNPYVNEIHQCLAALVDRSAEARARIIARLSEWLSNVSAAGRGRPIVRNFAAYVLGMIRAVEAEEALAAAARLDDGMEVRVYAICALGKLRSRRYLPMLAGMRSHPYSEEERMLIGQAMCRITGMAGYEL